jgi:hypothetical protein
MDGYFEKILHGFQINEVLRKKNPVCLPEKIIGWMMGFEPMTLRITKWIPLFSSFETRSQSDFHFLDFVKSS